MNHSDQPIAISGAGCVLATGWGVERFWAAAREGRSAIGPLRARHFRSRRIAAFGHVDEEAQQRCAKEVPRNLHRYCTPAVFWGVSAVGQALHEAGIDPRQSGLRLGLYGCQGGYTHPSLDAYAELLRECRSERGLDKAGLSQRVLQGRGLDPFLVLKSLSNGLLGVVSLAHRLECEGSAFMQGVAGNQAALREACAALRSRRIDAAIVVGAGSELDALALTALVRAGVISASGAEAFLAFDEEGRGGVAGEGAAALVLQRCADVPAATRTCLVGQTAHAGLDGLSLPQEASDLLVCAGTGVPEQDRRLSGSLTRLQAAHVAAAQPLTGILSAAPSLVELILARCAMRDGYAPPLAGLRRPVDPRLAFVVGSGRQAAIRRATVVSRDDNGFSACYRLERVGQDIPHAATVGSAPLIQERI